MSYKTNLQSNNNELQEILTTIQELPNGDDLVENLRQETWTFTLKDGTTVEKVVPLV